MDQSAALRKRRPRVQVSPGPLAERPQIIRRLWVQVPRGSQNKLSNQAVWCLWCRGLHGGLWLRKSGFDSRQTPHVQFVVTSISTGQFRSLAQSSRASVSGTEGRERASHNPDQKVVSGCSSAQSRAPALEAGGRERASHHPDHLTSLPQPARLLSMVFLTPVPFVVLASRSSSISPA